MADSQPRIAALQRRIARLSRSAPLAVSDRIATGVAAVDVRIGGGLARGRLHEIVAAAEDVAAGAGFAAMLARQAGGALVWLRVAGPDGGGGGALHPPGLVEVGIDPDRVLLVLPPDPPALLRAAGEVIRCPAVGAAVIELWRQPRLVDLTVSRRLVLAAEASGVTPLLLRIAAEPVPSAAHTRWGVTAAPSAPLTSDPTGAPGWPALTLELLRQRGGPAGGRWQVEWDRDRAEFRPSRHASLPGDLAAVLDGGSLAGVRRAAG